MGDDDDDSKRAIPPNGNVPVDRRPSINNFPYAPGYNVSSFQLSVMFIKIFLLFCSHLKGHHR